jgi:hypothetical protein
LESHDDQRGLKFYFDSLYSRSGNLNRLGFARRLRAGGAGMSNPVLQARALSKKFVGVQALDKVSLEQNRFGRGTQ